MRHLFFLSFSLVFLFYLNLACIMYLILPDFLYMPLHTILCMLTILFFQYFADIFHFVQFHLPFLLFWLQNMYAHGRVPFQQTLFVEVGLWHPEYKRGFLVMLLFVFTKEKNWKWVRSYLNVFFSLCCILQVQYIGVFRLNMARGLPCKIL